MSQTQPVLGGLPAAADQIRPIRSDAAMMMHVNLVRVGALSEFMRW